MNKLDMKDFLGQVQELPEASEVDENPHDPLLFASSVPPLHISSAWQQHQELITHLCQFSQNVLLLVAPPQGGKSTFVRHFAHKSGIPLHRQVLKADPSLSVENLMKKIAAGFELRWEESETLSVSIQLGIEDAYYHDSMSWLLIVDDAHLLTHEQMQALLQLIKFDKEPQEQLHLVLVGEPSLELRLFSPEVSELIHGKIYTIELESWTLEDISIFLAKNSALSLTADKLAFIFESTRGLPGYVARERKMLLERLASHPSMGQYLLKKAYASPIVLGVIAGLLLGVGYLLFNHPLDESLLSNEAQLNEEQVKLPLLENRTQEVAYHFDKAEKAEKAEKVDKVEIAQAPVLENSPQVAQAENSASPPIENVVMAAAHPEINPASLNEPVKEITKEAKKEPIKESIKERVAEKKESVTRKTRQKSMKSTAKPLTFVASNRHHYTLQLLGASNPNKVKQFMQEHRLEGKAKSFNTKREGKDWYIIVYGEYSSANEARKAIDKMPLSLRANLQPWPREIQAVNEDIRQHWRG